MSYCLKKNCIDSLFGSYLDIYKGQPYMFCALGAIVAAVGLASNSSTAVIGSMLLSPLLSSVVHGVLYGFLGQYIHVEQRESWIVELLKLILLTLVIGFVWGLFFQVLKNPLDESSVPIGDSWPTQEMSDRAQVSNALYMIPIALVCGIALPFAIRRNNTVALVGIGIATALLPPLVNIGISTSTLMIKGKTEELERERKEYFEESVMTGIIIFVINVFLLWLPTQLLMKYICIYDSAGNECLKNVTRKPAVVKLNSVEKTFFRFFDT